MFCNTKIGRASERRAETGKLINNYCASHAHQAKIKIHRMQPCGRGVHAS